MKPININQKKAINTVEGPVLIIAGPGTGKTYTLVERVCHMVGNLNIDPSSILISTFTNKAARELLDRLNIKFKQSGLKRDVNDMLLGNFHGICRKILEDNVEYLDFRKGFSTIDDVEKKYLIYRHLNYFKKIPGYYDIINGKDVYKIDKITKTVFEEGILERKSNNPKIQTVLDIVSLYEKILISKNKMDFSGQLFFTYKLLENFPQVRNAFKNKIQYVMIDEYQDTNAIQEKIIFSILNYKENICVVGDDDQGLYRFRGATVRNILQFHKRLDQKVEFIELDINYRSKWDIVRFYNRFIGSIDPFYDIEKYRFKKHLRADDESKERSVFKLEAKDEDEYREELVNLINKLKDSGKIENFNQVAILVSSVNDSRIMRLKTSLKKNNIGVYTPRTSKLINKDEAKLVIGAIYAVFYPYIQKKNIKLSYDSFQFLGISHKKFFQYEKEDDSLSNFVSEMSDYIMKDNFTISLLDIFYRFFRYRPFSEILEDKSKDQAHKNISRMLELIYNFCQMETLYYIHPKNIEWFVKVFFDAFIGFICKENVPEFEEDTIIPDKNEISLITIHSSKGMEYPVVIMGSLWDRPYKNYESPFDKFLDEFLKIYGKTDFEPYKFISVFDFYRKYYTGFSRAKNLLILAGINDEKREDLIGIELRLFYKRLLEFDQEALDKLKEMPAEDKKVKDLYSYTQDIAQYNYCPRAYKFFRKLRFTRTLHPGMTYGSIIHETIEYINKSIIKGQKPNKNQITQKIKEIAKNKYKNGATFIGKNMLQSASKEIQKYYEHLDKLDQILDSELEISLVSEDYMIVGNVDMVYKKDQNINIIDFKTGLNPIKLGNKDLLNQYLGQLYLYANLYEKTKNEKIANVSLYFTSLKNDQQFIDKKLEDSHLQNSMKDVEKTIQQIEQDHIFEKTTDINKCKNCDLRFLCDRIDIDTH